MTFPEPVPIYPDSEVELAAFKLLEALVERHAPLQVYECSQALVEAFGYASWEQWVELNS
jgi:hypothetical protein